MQRFTSESQNLNVALVPWGALSAYAETPPQSRVAHFSRFRLVIMQSLSEAHLRTIQILTSSSPSGYLPPVMRHILSRQRGTPC